MSQDDFRERIARISAQRGGLKDAPPPPGAAPGARLPGPPMDGRAGGGGFRPSGAYMMDDLPKGRSKPRRASLLQPFLFAAILTLALNFVLGALNGHDVFIFDAPSEVSAALAAAAQGEGAALVAGFGALLATMAIVAPARMVVGAWSAGHAAIYLVACVGWFLFDATPEERADILAGNIWQANEQAAPQDAVAEGQMSVGEIPEAPGGAPVAPVPVGTAPAAPAPAAPADAPVASAARQAGTAPAPARQADKKPAAATPVAAEATDPDAQALPAAPRDFDASAPAPRVIRAVPIRKDDGS